MCLAAGRLRYLLFCGKHNSIVRQLKCFIYRKRNLRGIIAKTFKFLSRDHPRFHSLRREKTNPEAVKCGCASSPGFPLECISFGKGIPTPEKQGAKPRSVVPTVPENGMSCHPQGVTVHLQTVKLVVAPRDSVVLSLFSSQTHTSKEREEPCRTALV